MNETVIFNKKISKAQIINHLEQEQVKGLKEILIFLKSLNPVFKTDYFKKDIVFYDQEKKYFNLYNLEIFLNDIFKPYIFTKKETNFILNNLDFIPYKFIKKYQDKELKSKHNIRLIQAYIETGATIKTQINNNYIIGVS